MEKSIRIFRIKLFMVKISIPKVFVDSAVNENIPSVAVSNRLNDESPEESDVKGVKGPLQKAVHFSMDFLETAVVALSIFVVVYLFLVQPHEIKGSSMEPNFQNDEYILTDKISFKMREPKRGEVIIFKAPKNPDVDYIKRVIALPGERVKVQNGAVYVNGNKLNEPYLNDTTNIFPGQFMQEGVEITVPESYVFALGDNRQHSSDSREFGPVKEDQIIGRALLRYWPINKVGIIPDVKY